MGLRFLAILILIHATIAPALYAFAATATATSAAAPAACCCIEACAGCGCVLESSPETPTPAPTPPPPSRPHDELLRSLALPGARVIDSAELPWRLAMPEPLDSSRTLPPVAFRGATAQAALCVRTT